VEAGSPVEHAASSANWASSSLENLSMFWRKRAAIKPIPITIPNARKALIFIQRLLPATLSVII
jgi:hypothetical protein